MADPIAAHDTPTKAPGVRARVRAELTAEIKASARRQLATHGAAALSLRAISRELDMASSAIYRYFASRDELLTALIIDAYDAVGAVVEAADAAVERGDYHERFHAMALALRAWAVANPHEYALIYGSPVPGYAAPQDTIDPAARIPTALITVMHDQCSAGGKSPSKVENDPLLAASMRQLMEVVEDNIPAAMLARGVRAWGEIFGLISLELFGHFNNAVTDPAAFFDQAIDTLAKETLQ